MGNSLCCSQHDAWHDINEGVIGIDTKKRISDISKATKGDSPEYLQRRIIQSGRKPRGLENKSKLYKNYDIPSLVFELTYPFPVKHLSFSQRRFLGFRNRIEFDKKRLVFGSKKDFVVIGYDYEKRVYELLRSFVSFDEEIRFISFLEDNVPSYLFLICWNKKEQCSYFKILKLKKNKNIDKMIKLEETKSHVTDQIIENMNKGKFQSKRRKSYDNMELIPSKDLQIGSRQQSIQSIQQTPNTDIRLQRVNTQPADDEDDDQQPKTSRSSIGISGIITKMMSGRKDGSVTPTGLHETNNNLVQQDKPLFALVEDSKDDISDIEYNNMNDPSDPTSQKADNLNNEYPFVLDEFGKLQLPEKVKKAFLFNNPVGTYLFTIEEGKRLSIFVIKSYINQAYLKDNATFYLKQTTKISNFRMAKRATLELEFAPRHLEYYGDYFIITYNKQERDQQSEMDSDAKVDKSVPFIPYIDIFEKTGKPISRVDLSDILKQHNLDLLEIKKIKFPKLAWSNRKIEEMEYNKSSCLKKVVVVGDCQYQDKRRPFLAKLNLEQSSADVIKILSIDDKITEINFGPYDNGYLLIGLQSGQLLVFDVVQLDKIQAIQLFTSPIKQITFDPAHMIFVGSMQGEVAALNVLKKELHYVYLDLGKKQYCTVALPRNAQSSRSLQRNGNSLYPQTSYFNDTKQTFCCI